MNVTVDDGRSTTISVTPPRFVSPILTEFTQPMHFMFVTTTVSVFIILVLRLVFFKSRQHNVALLPICK